MTRNEEGQYTGWPQMADRLSYGRSPNGILERSCHLNMRLHAWCF